VTSTSSSGADALRHAECKARYSHRDWIVWCDHAGQWYAARKDAASLKAALHAVGRAMLRNNLGAEDPRGYFWLCTGLRPSRVFVEEWSGAVTLLVNLRYGV